MVTSRPTCCWTIWKFCRKAESDTSAQVGRVADRALCCAVIVTVADYIERPAGIEVTCVPITLRVGGALGLAAKPLHTRFPFHQDKIRWASDQLRRVPPGQFDDLFCADFQAVFRVEAGGL